jgi:uncharacterized protein DUF2330
MRGRTILVAGGTVFFMLIATPALACGGLIAPNGSVSLVRTTTMAAYHDGVEHYVTSFEFAGGGKGEFGSIVPLPGVPTEVVRGGDWTLQRLVQETQPQPPAEEALFASAAADSATVILKTEIDALDVVVLEGGGTAVGNWAREHGFLLPPDAPEVLDFYASRSPIFMAIRYDAARAREQGLSTGDGTPVHVTIPTPNPWVPLRILGLGAGSEAPVEADVYLLTDREPSVLPAPTAPARGGATVDGLVLETSQAASDTLLADLRSDKGMQWMPRTGMWLTYLRVDERAGDLTYDLAVDATGAGQPSPVAAGLGPVDPALDGAASSAVPIFPIAAVLLIAVATSIVIVSARRRGPVGSG